jgi:hypothetical protein
MDISLFPIKRFLEHSSMEKPWKNTVEHHQAADVRDSALFPSGKAICRHENGLPEATGRKHIY